MKRLTLILLLLSIVCITPNLFSQKYNDVFSGKIDTGYVNVEGAKLFYEISGEGEWIVLLHDGIVHREVWDNQFPVFAKKYRVIRFDRRGYGKSTFPSSKFSHIEDINQVFVQLKIDKAMVFGISGGGKLAIDFTLKYPEKVKTLVLVGAVVSGYGITNHTITRGGRLNSIMDIVTDPQKFLNYMENDDPYQFNPKNQKIRKKFIQLLKENPNDINFQREILVLPEERPALRHLSEIKVPTLVLVGEFDMPDIHANAGVIEVGIPNAKRDVIYNAGHLIPFEEPKAFNEAVFKYFYRLEFDKVLNEEGVDALVKYFKDRKTNEPEIVFFEEAEMNTLGYQYLQNGKVKDAIELFKLNILAYPNSSNVYDSLGEGYMNDGQTELAIKNYEKSLELNPNNTNAIEMLKKIKKTK